MAKTTVFVDLESEAPVALSDADRTAIEEGIGQLTSDGGSVSLEDIFPGGIGIEDYYVVSEWSLRVAVRALQHVAFNSRCHNSRVAAGEALKAVGMTQDMETDENGFPVTVKFEDHERPDNLPLIENHYRMWEG